MFFHFFFGKVELARINDGRPPLLIDATIEHLLSVASMTEGMFRLSGSQVEVEKLIEDFTYGRSPNLDSLSTHVVCGALKQLLRELPNPLLTFELHESFCQATQKRSHNEIVVALQKCILKVKKRREGE